MPRWCATTPAGLEAITRAELARHGAKPVERGFAGDGLVGFDVRDHEEGRVLLHEARTVERLGPVLAWTRVDPHDPWEELSELVDEVELAGWIDESTSWALRVTRYGEHPYGSPDVERRVGGLIDERLTRELPGRPEVDLEDPDAHLRIHLDDQGHLVWWLDLVGPASLHRRTYRRRTHPAAMRPTIAAGLLERLGVGADDRVADPMAGAGTLPIEAAWRGLGVSPVHLRAGTLRAHRLPRWQADGIDRGPGVAEAPADRPDPWIVHGDHAPNRVEDARVNLEAAGVSRLVHTYVGDVFELPDHLDEADAVVVNPPYGVRSGEGDLASTYERLVDAALKTLAPGGQLGLLTPRRDLLTGLAEERGLETVEDLAVRHGRLTIRLIVLGS